MDEDSPIAVVRCVDPYGSGPCGHSTNQIPRMESKAGAVRHCRSAVGREGCMSGAVFHEEWKIVQGAIHGELEDNRNASL